MLTKLAHWLQETLGDFQKLVVAYSGGMDSHVLLHGLWQLKQKYSFQLSAVHIDHGFLAEASLFEAHCQAVCRVLEISLTIIPLKHLPQKGDSIEAALREARYEAFENALSQEQLLLTAHHQEDQAETFLLQALRGAGLKGLQGIAPFKRLKRVPVARPLLSFSQEQLREYALFHALQWIEDPSNQSTRFRRNHLRHQVLPLLQERSPGMSACLARSAALCREAQALLDSVLQSDYEAACSSSGRLLLAYLRSLPALRQEALLRFWLAKQKVPLPSYAQLHQLKTQMIEAREDAQPCFVWKGGIIRRFGGQLFLQKTSDPPTQVRAPLFWQLETPLSLGKSRWMAFKCQGRGIALHKLPQSTVSVTLRRGGERCRPVGSPMSRALKKLFQERAVPPWERFETPLFYANAQLVAVGEWLICEGWQTRSSKEWGWVIERRVEANASEML